MKIEFLKPVQGFAHVPGDVAELEDAKAKELIELGFCVQTKEDVKSEKKKESEKK